MNEAEHETSPVDPASILGRQLATETVSEPDLRAVGFDAPTLERIGTDKELGREAVEERSSVIHVRRRLPPALRSIALFPTYGEQVWRSGELREGRPVAGRNGRIRILARTSRVVVDGRQIDSAIGVRPDGRTNECVERSVVGVAVERMGREDHSRVLIADDPLEIRG